MSDNYRLWVDACSEMFGGLDMVAVKAVHGADGKDYIIEVTDCSMPLVGEKQEQDRKIISDLVLHKMSAALRPKHNSTASSVIRNPRVPQPMQRRASHGKQSQRGESAPPMCPPSTSASAPASPPESPTHNVPSTSTRDAGSSRSSAPPSPGCRNRIQSGPSVEEEGSAEKIRNLRKSFASIFGD